MTTKIFVSQIDSTNPDGNAGVLGSYIVLTANGAVWASGNTPPTGYSGSAGSVGLTGATGYTGSVGPQGILGDMGFEGYQGSSGNLGYQGSFGFQGSEGFQGSFGFQGSTGLGYQGSQGDTGYVGSIGALGYQGSAGFQGSRGDIGYKGSTGDPFNPQLNFTGILDLSPNVYTGAANYFVKVNPNANGITLDGNVHITNSISTDVNFSYNTILKPVLASIGERVNVLGNTGNSILVNSANGNIATLTLTPTVGNVVTVEVSANNVSPSGVSTSLVMYISQDVVGGRSIDWSLNTIRWPAAEGVPITGPTLSTTASYTDVITLTTLDGGTSWYGFLSAKGFV
jgi:hypothetical protein